MRFWDSSALVPLFVTEETSNALEFLFRDDQNVTVWWGSEVECASAAARLERSGELTSAEANGVFRQIVEFASSWTVIEPAEAIRVSARRFLRVHELRAADALQLAAAFLSAEGRPASLQFVCLDDRLATAAYREGFHVIDRAGLDAL